jgi:hypothetical protein
MFRPFLDDFPLTDASQRAHGSRENCASRQAHTSSMDLPVSRRTSIAMSASLARSSAERAPTIGLTIST